MAGVAGNTSGADERFAEFVATGSQEALADVVLWCTPELLVRARARTGNADEAADLVQATLLAAIEARARFDPRRRLMPWLIGILDNLHRYWRRRRRSRPLAAGDLEPVAEFEPSSLVDRKLVREAVAAAVAALPERYRQVVALHLHEERSPEEIGRILGRPSATIRTQLWRGLRMLRGLLPPSLALAAWVWIAVRSASAQGGGAGFSGDGDGEPPAAARGGGVATPRTRALSFAAVLALVLLALGGGAVFAWLPRRGPGPVESGVGPSGERTAAAPTPAPGAVDTSTAAAPDRRLVANVATAKLSVALRWAEGDRPAAGQTLRLVAGSKPGTSLLQSWWTHVHHGVADAEGRVVFTGVPSGPARLLLDDALAIVEVDLIAGQSHERTVALQPRCRIEGQVVDADGQPVAGADVWLSSTHAASSPGYVAARSDAEGRFVAIALWPTWHTWATAAGHGCSFEHAEAQPALISRARLVLSGPAVRAAGRVVDETGAPSRGALLAVYPLDRVSVGVDGGYPPPQYCVADADGRFAFVHLPKGRFMVMARDATHRLHVHEFECDPATPELVVRLTEPGATIRGRVNLPPERLASLSVVAASPIPHVSPGSRGFSGSFGGIGADGSFELRHVQTGAVKLQVIGRRFRFQPGLEDQVFQLADHDVVTCELGTRAPYVLTGRVVDESGRGVQDITVCALPAGCDWDDLRMGAAMAISGPDGAFSVPLKNAWPHECFASDAPDAGADALHCARSGAHHAADGPLTLTLRSSDRSRASVRGLLPAKWPEAPELIMVHMPVKHRIRVPVADRGGFVVEHLPAGDYALLAAPRGGKLATVVGRFRLAGDQALDLGQLVAAEEGTLRFSARHRDGRPARLARPIWVQTPDGIDVASIQALDAYGAGQLRLPAGDYVLAVSCLGARGVLRDVQVQAAATADVEVVVDDGVPCRIVITLPPGVVSTRLVLEVSDASGARLARELLSMLEGNRFEVELGLPAGEVRLRAVTSTGETADTTIQVVAGSPSNVDLPLR